MSHPNPDSRLKKEYGSVKAALEYCVELNLNQTQAATFLQIDRSTLRNRAARLKVVFPCGYKTRDLTLANEINGKRLSEHNRLGITGGRRRWNKMEECDDERILGNSGDGRKALPAG